ncbi:hypothetical protein AB0M00_43880 [Streptomyces chartreusis]|uniref:hypothetical protein n=1 Tax=Streptomyces chartreusis TaxID=1969 RepID=UPI00342A48D4
MITSMLNTQTTNTLVRLDVDGDQAIIDMGDNPHYPKPVQVTSVAIAYTTTQTSDSAGADCEVASITYTVTGQDYSTISVHPDFLNKPEAWPAWARTLVDQYRPATPPRKLDSCHQCAAPAAGGRIPKHRAGCPSS